MTTLLQQRCVVDTATRESNILASLARGFPVCGMSPERKGKVAIVASGPSVRDYLDEILSFDGEVWAINGSYDFLVDQGRVPEGFVAIDPQPEMAMHVTKPQKKTAFYIASCCHAAVFDALDGHDVRLWHSNSDTKRVLPSGSVAVPGGGFCVTRAPFLAYLVGFRDVYVYGADCSYRDGDSHVIEGQEWKVREQDRPILALVNGQEFLTKTVWMQQASSLGVVEKYFPGKITFRCGGMLPAFLASERPIEDLIDPNEPIKGLPDGENS